MKFSLSSSPHKHIRRTTGQVMRMVLYAAIPGILVQTWFFGWGALVHFAIAAVTAIVCEVVMLELRGKDFERALKDWSAVVTALLIAISIPPFAPWWISVFGTVFAIVIVKQLYGGLGYNLFNPAMAAYVMLLVSFPVHMTSWLPPSTLMAYSLGPLDALAMIFTGFTMEGFSMAQLTATIDGVSMATPLDTLKTDLSQGLTVSESLVAPVFDQGTGVGWFWLNAAYLAGGLIMLKQRVINWHIPVAVLAGIALPATLMYLVDSDLYASPWFHLFSGGLMFGAFFIATDPVSGSTTNKGRLWFGFGIGAWVYVIRTWGGYPDAIAFAVLVMNMAVPLIDYYTQPRTYGHGSDHKKNIPNKAQSDR